MDYWLIAAAVLFVGVSLLIFKLVKKAIKAVIIVLSLTFIASLAFSAVVFVDAINFRNNFGNSSKVFILEGGGSVITGVYANEELKPIEQSALKSYSDYFEAGDYKSMLGNNDKLIIIDVAVMDGLESLEIDEQVFPAEAVKDVFSSTDEAAKQRFFSFMVAEVFGSPLFFFEQYKKGNIVVYPETPMFKFIRFIPARLIKSVAEKSFEKIKSAAAEKLR
jgi:Ni,Fe-hydrogenase maturation factor